MNEDPDPWLKQALKHAPDADATPPAALREAILRRARDAARASGARRLRAAWAALARPVPAAALATVAVAGVGFTVWRQAQQAPWAPAETVSQAPAPAAAPPAAERDRAQAKSPPPATQAAAKTEPPPSAMAETADSGIMAAPRGTPPATLAAASERLARGGGWTLDSRRIPHGPAQQAWLHRALALSAGHWTPASGPVAGGVPLQLDAGGPPLGTLRVAADRLGWTDAQGQAWTAPLAPAEGARLAEQARAW